MKKYACCLYSFIHILKSAQKVFSALEIRSWLGFFNVNTNLITFRLQLQIWFPVGKEGCKICWFVCECVYAGCAHCLLTPLLTGAISCGAGERGHPAEAERMRGRFMKCKLRSCNVNKAALKEVLFPAYIYTTLYFQAVVHTLCNKYSLHFHLNMNSRGGLMSWSPQDPFCPVIRSPLGHLLYLLNER